MSTTRITLGADVGGRAAQEATSAEVLRLRQLLAACDGSYSADIDELAIVLRIDGEIAAWDFEGIEKLRLAKKQRYVTVDVGVPMARWRRSPDEFSRYLAEQTKLALTAMIERLAKANITFDEGRFWKAVDPALQAFLAHGSA